MDETDIRLIQLLLYNARQPYRELADKLGLTVQAVHRRIQVLEDAKVIMGFTAHISVRYLGAVPVYCSGLTEETSTDRTIENLRRNDSIWRLVTGSGNMIFLGGLLRGISDLEPFMDYLKTAARIPRPSMKIEGLVQVGERAVPPTPSRTSELTPLDYRIIYELSKDSRQANADVAEALGVSVKTVTRRLDAMISQGAIDFETLAELGASSGSAAFVTVSVKPGKDRNELRNHLRKSYGPRMILIVSFSNITEDLLCLTWSPTNVGHSELIDELRKDERVAEVKSHLLVSGYYFDIWRDTLLAERATSE